MVFGLAAPTSRFARAAGAMLTAFALYADADAETGAQASRVAVLGVNDEIAAELRRVLPEETEPQSLFEARRQAERAADIVARVLESQGHYAATTTPEAEEGPPIQRRVRVEMGPLFTLVAARIAYPDGAPDATTAALLEALLDPLKQGSAARAQPIIDAGDAMLSVLRAQGYPDAVSDPVDALADGRAHTLELTFALRPGVRTTLSELEISGLERTRRDFVENLAPWRPGDRYSPMRLDELRTRLGASGLFDSVTVKLAEAPPNGSADAQTRDVTVEVREGPRRTLALGASASTSEGLGVEGEWERRNLSGRGDSLQVRAKIATLQSTAGIAYRRPNVGKYGRNALFDTAFDRFETDAFDQSGGKITATLEDQLTPRLRGSIGAETAYASIADARARSLGLARREVWLAGASLTAEYTGVRDILDPRNGVRARVAVEPGLTWGDSRIGFTRVSTEASLYGDLGSDRVSGALRGRIGAVLGANGAPPDRLFFAGGGGSVRGYEFQSLSPRDAQGALVGGRSLIETSAEVRWRATERFGLVGFIDAGAAGDGVEPPIGEMRAGAGLGLRYYAGFGPLRLDIAAPLDRRAGDSDFQVYLSIGQAF